MFTTENKFFFLLIITTILFGFKNSETSNTEDGNITPVYIGVEYFAFHPDVKLIYESTFGETVCTTWFENDEYVQEFIGDEFKMIQQLKLDTDKLCLTYLEQKLEILFFTAHSIQVTYSEPAKLVSIPIQKDIISRWTGLEYVNDYPADTIVITSEYVGNETIVSEAGQFDCIKLAYAITKSSGRVNKYTEWRAPDVGLVQLTAEVDQKGFIGLITKILGYDEIVFLLKKIES